MSDEFAARKDVDSIGIKVNGLCVDFARCQGRNEGIIIDLQRDTLAQWEGINELKSELHLLETGMLKMRDDMVNKISARLGIIISVATILIIAIQVASMIK